MQTQPKPQAKQQHPKITGIYEISTKDGRYIGQSTSIIDRAYEHLYGRDGDGLTQGKHDNRNLQAAWHKDPQSFTLHLIQECDRSDLKRLEAYWIAKRGDLNIQRPKVPFFTFGRMAGRKLLKFVDILKDKDKEAIAPPGKAKPTMLSAWNQLLYLVLAGVVGAVIIKSLLLPWQWGFWAGAIGCYLSSLIGRK